MNPYTATRRGGRRLGPADFPGCILWCEASPDTITLNAGNVSQWRDQSGRGNHLVQATAANQPEYRASGIGGKPGLYFQDAARKMATAGALWTGAATRTLVSIYDPGSAAIKAIAGQTGTSTAGAWFLLWSVLSGTSRPYFTGNSRDVNGNSSYVAGQVSTLATYSGTVLNLYQNGSLAGSGTFALNTNNAPFYVGYSDNAFGNELSGGSMSFVASWSRALSAAEIARLASLTRALYGHP